MLTAAVALFAFAALGGVALAAVHFRGHNPPLPLALVHGLFAAAGLLAFALAALQAGVAGMQAWSLGIFLVAAVGGFTLLTFHLRQRRLPSALVLAHGGAATTAFILLALAVAHLSR